MHRLCTPNASRFRPALPPLQQRQGVLVGLFANAWKQVVAPTQLLLKLIFPSLPEDKARQRLITSSESDIDLEDEKDSSP